MTPKKRPANAPRVMVKFTSWDEPDRRSDRISELLGREQIRQTRQLFPGDADEGLASIFEVTLEDAVSVAEVMTALDQDDDVEYCHRPGARGPRR